MKSLMERRREIMLMAMAQGAEVIKGSFTVPADFTGTYTLNYGKSFSSYILLIDMAEESKQDLYDETSINNTISYFFTAINPPQTIVDKTDSGHAAITLTYNPSSGNFGTGQLGSTAYTDSSFAVYVRDLNGSGTTRLVKGFSYNYVLISLDGINWR